MTYFIHKQLSSPLYFLNFIMIHNFLDTFAHTFKFVESAPENIF